MTLAHCGLERIEVAGDDEARRVVASFRDLHPRIQHWEHLYFGR